MFKVIMKRTHKKKKHDTSTEKRETETIEIQIIFREISRL